jgi:hypothetical protein
VEISWVAQVTWRNFLLSFAGNFALLTFLIPWLGKLSSRSSCWYCSCNCVLFALVWGDMAEISLEIFPWFIEISRVSCYFRSASDAGITLTVSSALQRKKRRKGAVSVYTIRTNNFLLISSRLPTRCWSVSLARLAVICAVSIKSQFFPLSTASDIIET